jgi:hypothetical protein
VDEIEMNDNFQGSTNDYTSYQGHLDRNEWPDAEETLALGLQVSK